MLWKLSRNRERDEEQNRESRPESEEKTVLTLRTGRDRKPNQNGNLLKLRQVYELKAEPRTKSTVRLIGIENLTRVRLKYKAIVEEEEVEEEKLYRNKITHQQRQGARARR
ncbi:hypothetical protein EVAR_41179_1 [Eumeta japonica]|uniref:Uncharacterized protein n=1 Tax=Eumeta variegata TaxID=151549 RepID=A0A4C1WTB8_EUMVA|nr:hypothetical protein EVAR_41179_1 [Eumeta japonica]